MNYIKWRRIVETFFVTIIIMIFSGCGGGTGDGNGPSDNASPAPITDLITSNPHPTSIDLSWTAPGDDGNSGTVTGYDIRYSESIITDVNWDSATPVTGEPAPQVAGTNQSMTVTGLIPGTTYFFAMISLDEVPNTSNISNITVGTPDSSDTTLPAPITNLYASNSLSTSIEISWTSPGDDGNSGTATGYDIRYAASIITDANWDSVTPVTGEPAPQVAGTNQSMTVSGLIPGTTYYFAMKTLDEVPNVSELSNVVLASTYTDSTPPTAINNLFASHSISTSIDLSWTAPGDDGNSGTATGYDIRYAASIITDINWDSATPVTGEPAPQVAGTNQSMTVTGLIPGTTYYFAMKTLDEVPNVSELSNVESASTYNGSMTLAWDPPIENTDGTPLTDLAGYKIYYGTSSNSYTESIDLGNVTSATIDNLSQGQWCFTTTAYNTLGIESSYSTEICESI